jgi:hypothetical protein
MPVHHLLEQILNGYIEGAGLQSRQPLFQSVPGAPGIYAAMPFILLVEFGAVNLWTC